MGSIRDQPTAKRSPCIWMDMRPSGDRNNIRGSAGPIPIAIEASCGVPGTGKAAGASGGNSWTTGKSAKRDVNQRRRARSISNGASRCPPKPVLGVRVGCTGAPRKASFIKIDPLTMQRPGSTKATHQPVAGWRYRTVEKRRFAALPHTKIVHGNQCPSALGRLGHASWYHPPPYPVATAKR